MVTDELNADDQKSGADRKHPAGVKRSLVLFGILALAAAVPYLIPESAWPEVERLEAYREGDKIPFATILDFQPMTTPALGGVQQRAEREIADTAELLEVAPLPEPVAIEPVAARESDDPLRIEPEAYEGITQTIEDPHRAMAPFYERLRAVASDERTLARVALYTDSINASDRISSELRSEFAGRFGDGGKGFVPIAPGWQSQIHRDVEWQPEGGWAVQVVNRGELDDGRYGLAGVRSENRSQLSRVTFATSDEGIGSTASRFDLYYQAFDRGGSLTIEIDGGAPRTVAAASATLEDRVESIALAEGSHEITVRVGEGRVHLYGAVLERDGPGVVVDGLMLVGAFTRVLGHYDEAHWAAALDRRGTDLVVFMLGENDAVVEQVPFVRTEFVDEFGAALRASKSETRGCLVVSVLDSGTSDNGVIRSTRRVPGIVEAQREAALASGCAFWNAYEATGGTGTARRWFQANPRLLSGDFRHLTGEGARVLGTLLYRSILYGYDQHLAAR
jgi:hypothetical protein